MARASRASPSPSPQAPVPTAEPEAYTVVARRYRPQRFEDVVGQDHVVQSLRNAIRSGKVAQAYLFSGTRGVGKTSLARIFAKCLNCVRGPTDEPDLTCDICQAIAVGQDVNVIEIDGASNNGVEAVRELRQNASLRPVRARYKIYYIDEVHMLSTGAFNALLKTLEEPPAHVKFLFATTEPNRIPITVLSRCQRYDFAGIAPEQIAATLAEICTGEGVEAEPEALRAIARRAGGSMRDAQSLLEQLLSAGGERLTVELVHQRLGTASDERLLDLLAALADHDPAGALRLLEQASTEGVQPVEVLNGLLDYLRDVMVLSVGSEGELLAAAPRQRPLLEAIAGRWPLDSVLAALQILSEARGRLRGSPHARLVVELALVRVARLEDLAELGELIARLSALEGGAAPLAAASLAGASSSKKKPGPPDSAADGATSASDTPAAALDLDAIRQIWPQLLKDLKGHGIALSEVAPTAVASPNVLVIALGAGYDWVADLCEKPEARSRIEEGLRRLLHRPVTLRFDRAAEGAGSPSSTPAKAPSRRHQIEEDPMVQKVVELFEARPVHLEVEEDLPGPSEP